VTRQLFGTDGIRGKAGVHPLSPPTVYALGRAAGRILGGKDASALVAADTRESCGWIASHLVAGLGETGVSCRWAGVMPTPAVARVCSKDRYTFGAMISASHNPYQDNGIKFFSGDGFKLPDETENHIEVALEGLLPSVPDPVPSGDLGPPDASPSAHYLSWLESLWEGPSLEGSHVVLDCANGAASALAPQLFRRLGAKVSTLACEPDGRNINAGCGSLHTGLLATRVLEARADYGFAFDGDADRCLAVTGTGAVLDGDFVLYRDAQRRVKRGTLFGRWVVGTVMSNLWLEQALQAERLRFFRAPVGDRYVLQCMADRGATLGGEPSGHILFLDRATTGDGMLTALAYASLARDAGSMDALREGIVPYPQVLSNIRVANRLPLEEQPAIQGALDEETARLGARGRIVLRYSGTEPLLRLMVEAQTRSEVDGVVGRLGKVLRDTLGEG
jgi:phosphoglucosamine mutase